MKAFRVITSTTTVDDLASETWDLRDPSSGLVTAERLERATTPLRLLNPNLPSDGSSFGSASVPFVVLPWLPGLPLRPPAIMRADLEAIGLFTIDQVSLLNPTFLTGKLLGGATTDPARAVGTAQLMGVPGISAQLAEALYDDTTSVDSLDTPAELVAADQANLKTLLQALAIGGSPLPAYFLGARPWYLLQRRAKRSMPATSRRQVRMLRRPILESHATLQINRWTGHAASVRRSAVGRNSAAHVSFAYQFAKQVSTASVASASGQHGQAARIVTQIYKNYGALAVQYGIVAPSSDQATGPSLQTVLEVTRRVLDEMDDADSSNAAKDAGLETPALAFRAFTVDQLETAERDTVTNALSGGGHRVSDVGMARLDTLAHLATDTTAASLPWANLGIGTPNTASLVRDYTGPDRERMYENGHTASFAELTSSVPMWDAFRKELPLRDVRALVGTVLDQGGSTPSATATFSPATIQESGINTGVNPNLSDSVTPFDRWVEWTSHAGNVYRAPLNGAFEERYRQDVLLPILADSASATGELQFPSEHFNDPAAILFLAPMMFSRHFHHILSRSARAAGASHAANAYLVAQPTTAQLAAGPLDVSLLDVPQEGATDADSVDCLPPQDLFESLQDMLVEGETAFRRGEHDRATKVFNELLDLAARCPWLYSHTLETGEVLDELPDVTIDPLVRHTLSDAWIVDVIPDTSRALLDFGLRLPPVRREDLLFREIYQVQTFNYLDTVTRYAAGVVSFEEDDDFDRAARNIAVWSDPAASGQTGQSRGDYSYFVDYRAQIQTLVLQAALHLRTLARGLNWLGFSPSYVPIWSFEYLIGQAQQFSSRAEQLQNQALSYLMQAEDRALRETQQVGAAELADLGLTVARLEKTMAQQRAQESIAREQAARERLERSKEAKVWGIVASIGVVTVAVTGTIVTAGTIGPVALAGAAALSAAPGAISTGANYQSNQSAQEEALAQVEIAVAERATAETSYRVAQAGVDVARARAALDHQVLTQMFNQETNSENLFALHGMVARIADAQLRMANMMAWLAQQALWFESRRRPDVIQPGYAGTDFPTRYSVASQLRTDIDALIQSRVLAKQNPDQLIKTTFSVLEENPVALYAIRENGGIELAITQKMLDLRYPGLFGHRVRRIEVEFIGLVPFNGINGILHRTGTARVRVPFTRDYIPELFGPDVEIDTNVLQVIEDWSYPSAGGAASVPDTWDYGTGSRTEWTTFPAYALAKLVLPQQVQVLSEYRRAKDGTVLSVQPGLLDTLENSPPTGTWFIELPAHSNPGDLQNIADVRITLHFSAEYDPNLAAQQAHILKNDASASVGRSVNQTLATKDVNALARLTGPPRDRSRTDVRLAVFDFDSTDFPAGLSQRDFDNFFIGFFGLQGEALTVTVKSSADSAVCRFGRRQATNVVDGSSSDKEKRFPDGTIASNAGRTTTFAYGPDPGDVFPALEGFQAPMDAIANAVPSTHDMADSRWVVKVVEESSNSAFRALNDDGDDDSETTGKLALAGGGSATTDIGTWANVQVQATVALADGGLTLTAREGTPNAITATLTYAAGSPNTLTATLSETGGSSDTLVDTDHTLDAWYVVRLEVTKNRARLFLDEILICEIGDSTPLAAPVAGNVAFSFAGSTPSSVADVRITSLRYDGTPLGVALEERFVDTSAWTLAAGGGSAVRTDVAHHFLDLSAVADVVIALDYNASIAT